MTRPVTNVAASVRQRLLNESKRRRETFDYVASLYARERFLARLSVSPHRSRLILKGATVMALWVDAHPEFPSAKVKVYPPETIVAEKLHALS